VAVVRVAPLLLAVAGMDDRPVSLGCVVGGLDHAEAALATDGFAARESLALFGEARRLLLAPRPLALLTRGLLLGAMAVDGGGGDAPGELVEDVRPAQSCGVSATNGPGSSRTTVPVAGSQTRRRPSS